MLKTPDKKNTKKKYKKTPIVNLRVTGGFGTAFSGRLIDGTRVLMGVTEASGKHTRHLNICVYSKSFS